MLSKQIIDKKDIWELVTFVLLFQQMSLNPLSRDKTNYLEFETDSPIDNK